MYSYLSKVGYKSSNLNKLCDLNKRLIVLNWIENHSKENNSKYNRNDIFAWDDKMINNNNNKNNIKTNRVEETIQKNIDLTRKNFSCTIW